MPQSSDVICFTQDAMIATSTGTLPIQALREGDKVITRDNGLQEVAWIGQKTLNYTGLIDKPDLQPIIIKAGSLGHNQPARDLMVSPNHRMLVTSDVTAQRFSERETLIAAKLLVGETGISRANVRAITYFHVLFENHEVILGNGAWSESFQPGDCSVSTLTDRQRAEIFGRFPCLKDPSRLNGIAPARRALDQKDLTELRLH